MSWQVTTVNRLFDLIGENGKVRHFRVQTDGVKIQDVAKKIVKGPTGVDCFFLVVCHNGKRGIAPKEFNYMSWAMGYYEDWIMPRFDMMDYQNIELTYEHQDLLRKVKHDGVLHIDTDKLLDDRLKMQLKHMGLQKASFYHLYENKFSKWFVMAGSAVENDDHFLKLPVQQQLYLAVNSVKNVISKYK